MFKFKTKTCIQQLFVRPFKLCVQIWNFSRVKNNLPYFLGYKSHFFSNSWYIFLSATYIAKVSLNSTPFQALASACTCNSCIKIKSIATVYLASMATKRTSYTVSFKLKVVQETKKGRSSQRSICKQLPWKQCWWHYLECDLYSN